MKISHIHTAAEAMERLDMRQGQNRSTACVPEFFRGAFLIEKKLNLIFSAFEEKSDKYFYIVRI